MKRIYLLFLLVFIFITTPLFGQQRNVSPIKIKTNAGKCIELYKGSYALLIGVSQYTAGWPKLQSVPSELNSVYEALKDSGFEVDLVMDPDDETLKDAFDSFIKSYGYDETNRLLFFFSGHGYSRSEGTKGYLVPSNAPNPSENEKEFLRKALPMSQIIAWCKQMEAKHALLLFDSCFSGTIFKDRALPENPPYIDDLISRKVRQFITAGDADQTVPAESDFTPSFIKALRGEADLNKDGYITGTELGMYLHDKVIEYDKGQTPQYGKIKDPDLDEGDFVFISPVIYVDTGGGKEIIDSGKADNLRSTPGSLSQSEVIRMIIEHGFFQKDNNESGGFDNQFEMQVIADDTVIFDQVTKLMWQQSGSDYVSYEEAKTWVEQLNFAGYSDWRLPTLEEALSLMESEKNSRGLYIDSKFNKKQICIWTSDLVKGESQAWVVHFGIGCFRPYLNGYVRAVRSGQPD